MKIRINNPAVVIQRMSDFSTTTTNDKLANVVSAVANRLSHQRALFEEEITSNEFKIIRPFLDKKDI